MDIPVDQAKIEFANRLQRAMASRGYNQSELARRAEEHMAVDPDTGEKPRIGRDSISAYIRGRVLPTPHRLRALAKALRLETDELLPTRGVPSADSRNQQPVSIRTMDDGSVWLRINRAVSSQMALQIVNMLKEHDATSPNQ